jgi:pimeloyl-ACP methyl ester carboxylesterase
MTRMHRRTCMLAAAGGFCGLGGLFGGLAGCAAPPAAPAPPPELRMAEFMVPALDPGIDLYVRNKAPAAMSSFTSDRTLLFVHGATYPSETSFDLRVGGFSWMDYIAQRGYDVYLLDVRGYGRSTRPPAMAQPPEANPPFAHTEEAARDIEAVVDFILRRRGIRRLHLVGWSWGTTTAALYTTRHNDKVARLVLYAPVWTPPAAVNAPPPPTTAYRSVTVDAARQRWLNGVPADKQADLIPPGGFDAWARAVLDSDPDGARQAPPVIRAPNGVMADILGGWLRGRRFYDAAEIRVPTFIVKAEWDTDTPAAMAQGLFASLKNAPSRSYLEIGEGTHTLMLEKNRLQMFRAVQGFLEQDLP